MFEIARNLLVALLLLSTSGPAAAEDAKSGPVILALGTSLTAGFGLPAADAFTEKLQGALTELGLAAEVRNAGVSGDTSAGGLARLDWALAPDVNAVIVELGSNDALRGLDPAQTEANLESILSQLQEADLPVLLTGMRAPPNLGPDYIAAFEPIYERLAAKYDAILYPFFLDGVAAQPALNQPDGIHPNADGVDVIVKHLTPFVLQLFDYAAQPNP